MGVWAAEDSFEKDIEETIGVEGYEFEILLCCDCDCDWDWDCDCNCCCWCCKRVGLEVRGGY